MLEFVTDVSEMVVPKPSEKGAIVRGWRGGEGRREKEQKHKRKWEVKPDRDEPLNVRSTIGTARFVGYSSTDVAWISLGACSLRMQERREAQRKWEVKHDRSQPGNVTHPIGTFREEIRHTENPVDDSSTEVAWISRGDSS
jgi:hypothetical protein